MSDTGATGGGCEPSAEAAGFELVFPIEADVLEEAGEAGRVVVGVVSVAEDDGTETF